MSCICVCPCCVGVYVGACVRVSSPPLHQDINAAPWCDFPSSEECNESPLSLASKDVSLSQLKLRVLRLNLRYHIEQMYVSTLSTIDIYP